MENAADADGAFTPKTVQLSERITHMQLDQAIKDFKATPRTSGATLVETRAYGLESQTAGCRKQATMDWIITKKESTLIIAKQIKDASNKRGKLETKHFGKTQK